MFVQPQLEELVERLGILRIAAVGHLRPQTRSECAGLGEREFRKRPDLVPAALAGRATADLIHRKPDLAAARIDEEPQPPFASDGIRHLPRFRPHGLDRLYVFREQSSAIQYSHNCSPVRLYQTP